LGRHKTNGVLAQTAKGHSFFIVKDKRHPGGILGIASPLPAEGKEAGPARWFGSFGVWKTIEISPRPVIVVVRQAVPKPTRNPIKSYERNHPSDHW
jgi:hypothetical protein